MRILVDEIRLRPVLYAKAMLRHMGPEFWIVAIYPFYISWVWGSGEILPNYGWLEETPMYAGIYGVTIWEWVARSWEWVAGLLVIGPLLGGGTVLYDDYFDREVDRDNPRKRTLMFLKPRAHSSAVMAVAIGLFAASLAIAALISAVFLALSAVIVLLSLIYSTPPLRLKGRGGLDLLTNMLGFGVLCSLAGFSIAAPLREYPWLWLVPMLLGTGALFVPTTLADVVSDGRNGVRTIAVALGVRRAIWLTIALLFLANVAILAFGAWGYLYSPWVVVRVWPISVLELVPLFYLLRRPDLDNVLNVIFGTSTLMAIGTLLLALNHVGIWGP